MVAFVAVMLGSVAFDGLSLGHVVDYRLYDLDEHLVETLRAPPTSSTSRLQPAGLVAAVILVALVFLIAVRAAQAVSGSTENLTSVFVASLIPIALAYAIATIFTRRDQVQATAAPSLQRLGSRPDRRHALALQLGECSW